MMQNFRVTVNGKIFEVTVEETNQAAGATQPAATVEVPAPAPAAPAAAAAPALKTGTVEAGDKPVKAPLSGSILSIKVKPGESVKYGQVLLTLEALKMENEIVAPEAGTVKEIFVQNGTMVNVGDVLLTLK